MDAQVLPITSAGAAPSADVPDRSHAARWGGHAVLFDSGYVPTPTAFLKHYSRMGTSSLTTAEAMFVLQLMVHKWDQKAPFPSYATIAKRMGISTAYARRLARDLQIKGLLRRAVRVGTTNRFDLTPLFAKLASVVEQEAMSRREAAA